MPGTPADRLLSALVALTLLSGGAFAAWSLWDGTTSSSFAPIPSPREDPLQAVIDLHVKGGAKKADESGKPNAYDSAGFTATAGDGLSLLVDSATLSFGELEPGTMAGPIPLTVTNTGLRPFHLSVQATALEGPDGARIPGARLKVAEGAGEGPQAAIVPPGSGRVLLFTLEVPSGDDAYIPSGLYEGIVRLTATAPSG